MGCPSTSSSSCYRLTACLTSSNCPSCHTLRRLYCDCLVACCLAISCSSSEWHYDSPLTRSSSSNSSSVDRSCSRNTSRNSLANSSRDDSLRLTEHHIKKWHIYAIEYDQTIV